MTTTLTITLTTFAITTTMLAACGVPPETLETGPTIVVYFDPPNSSSLDSNDLPPGVPATDEPDYESMLYVYDVSITTQDGETDTMKGFETHPVTAMDLAITADGLDIPASPITSDQSIAAVTWTRRDPLILDPAVARGKDLHIHAVGTDANGLRSNVVDWVIQLR